MSVSASQDAEQPKRAGRNKRLEQVARERARVRAESRQISQDVAAAQAAQYDAEQKERAELKRKAEAVIRERAEMSAWIREGNQNVADAIRFLEIATASAILVSASATAALASGEASVGEPVIEALSCKKRQARQRRAQLATDQHHGGKSVMRQRYNAQSRAQGKR